MYLKELTNEEFTKFTDSFKYSSIYQTSEYGLIMNHENYDTIFVGLIDNEVIIAASLILIEKEQLFKYAYAPKGLLVDYDNKYIVEEFTKSLKEYLNKKKICAVKINPMIIRGSYDYKTDNSNINPKFESTMDFLKNIGYNHLGFNNLFESFRPRFDAIINLNKSINILYSNIDKSFKNKIKGADISGVRIIKGSIKELDYLYEQVKNKYPRDKKYLENLFKYFGKRNMLDYFYAKLDTNIYLVSIQKKYQKQIELCNKINGKLFKNAGKNNNKIIKNKIREETKLNEIKNELINATNLLKDNPDGIVIASILVAKYKKEVYMLIDGFDKNYKKINAKHLMIWKLIEKYSKEKFKRFNLGGLTNPTVQNDKFNGLNEFKLSFGSKCIEYVGDFELVVNQALYNLYKNSKTFKYILKRDK